MIPLENYDSSNKNNQIMIGTSNIPIVIKDVPKQPSVGKILKNCGGKGISNLDEESSNMNL